MGTGITLPPRKANLPAKLEDAIRGYQTAVAECMKIDDAKYWADAAEACAAWAKINRDERILKESMKMKKYALVRMAQLAIVLTPADATREKPGAKSFLVAKGVSKSAATAALRVARANNADVKEVLNSNRGLGAESMRFVGNGRISNISSDAWGWLNSRQGGVQMSTAIAKLRRRHPYDVARIISKSEEEVYRARKLALEVVEWFDKFEQYLPKEGK